MYPFPQAQIEAILKKYPPSAELYWVQEEPRNMGPWRFMLESMQSALEPTKRMLHYAGRPESASPAAGTTKRHEQEQSELVSDAFAPLPVTRNPRRVRIVAKRAAKK
jgi:2-oxoglutarate dehydrogenase E1 component